METENLRIYDEHRVAQGVASRQVVHEKGYWHETFHCWVVSREKDRDMIYLQLRSNDKKDFPGLFDITAAGHLLADETVKDGVREVREELGLRVEFNELFPLGTIQDQLAIGNFVDNEHCHCFLYRKKDNYDETFELQKEEVAGMAKVDFRELAALIARENERIEVEGFLSTLEERQYFKKEISLTDLVPHSTGYLEKIIEQIEIALTGE
ncbi:NUDIX hydrolase [Planococcus donghaensis]|uniref:Nudix hydrolase domain-containing protein n=1 Tax=Planococcus donghaensis TaxID=414778 RepID=A0A1C7EMI2_9BACL|nr:NUDIX domain-containing protein [Planococcus donghaensis]ANU24567.1 hypothetical protein BCM40_14920 [Planococcus donghaensis]